MNTDYNLDELDVALSEARHQAAAVSGPPTRNESRRTAPSTRRGSLVPGMGAISSATSLSQGRKQQQQHRLDELNLFNFDLRELVRDVLLPPGGESRVSYHEYAVFAPKEPDGDTRSPSIMSEGEEGLQMFRNAVKNGHGLDDEGNFAPAPKGKHLLQGRVRQVIAHRHVRPESEGHTTHSPDGLHLTVEDYESLGLHSGTLPTLQRVTLESSFWDSRRETVYLILSFSSSPQPPYDFVSMAYKLRAKTTTALIRRSFDTRWHAEDALDEYERRLDSCRARWSHPLVLPVVLLQVQLFRTEEAVQANNAEVLELEAHVDAVTGTTGRANAEAWWRNHHQTEKHNHFHPLKRLGSNIKDMVEGKVGAGRRSRDFSTHNAPSPAPEVASYYDPDYVPPQTIHLMKEAHDVLKGAIQLLDTLRWMERALKLIIQAGDELDARIKELRAQAVARGQLKKEEAEEDDDLTVHWHEIRQYLDCTWRLCTSLETDRRMSELRCRAQIDIIYSKMAQEDNNLNARMAVASTRDSSSMKALAVITALFLPGEYIGTLFGVSMFDWETGTAADQAVSEDAPDGWPHPVVMPSFWIYWAFTIPLTLFIVAAWRAWWVNQDRYFRRHLSVDLSNERYWTTDGRPRDLETTFMQDFFSGLLSRSGAGSTSNSTILGKHPRPRSRNGPSPSVDITRSQSRTPIPSVSGSGLGFPKQGPTMSPVNAYMSRDKETPTDSEREGEGRDAAMRFRQISFARGPKIRVEGASAV
ncbi:hypothetical protein F5Y05DRAFT_411794 [Hypoxylon sp. FL0543]|nr:hypothetical protein F5Y05DRAFT_411794 [Hypoxylon sp. FL0543]